MDSSSQLCKCGYASIATVRRWRQCQWCGEVYEKLADPQIAPIKQCIKDDPVKSTMSNAEFNCKNLYLLRLSSAPMSLYHYVTLTISSTVLGIMFYINIVLK